jgi:hypothetical protein
MLALIGSGETSPTMVTVHRDLTSRLTSRHPQAIVLATPYAFQVNAADVSAKARNYFARSVGLDVTTAPGTSANADPAMAAPMIPAAGDPAGEAAGVLAADWVFAGPGSPPYALAHWQSGALASALRDRVLAGHGVTVLASAAAATAGRYTVPVYEIYKAGAAPRWIPGLDVLGPLGLKVAVIPHYDNNEGGSYDTRYCYLGERRLAALERQLPPDAAVLGIDEHTALLVDLGARRVEVRGRGAVTVSRAGTSARLPAGTTLSIAGLRDLATGAVARAAVAPPATAASTAATLPELVERARSQRDPARLAEVILELEAAIKQWGTDTEEDQGTDQARAVLRTLIGRLGQAAQAGLADRLRPAVQPLISLRAALRDEGRYAAADAIRDALAAAGLEVRDTPDGTRWEPETS